MSKEEKIREMLAAQIEQAHKMSTEICAAQPSTSKSQILVAKFTEAMAEAATAYAKLNDKASPFFPFSSLFYSGEDDEDEDEKPIEQGQTVKLKGVKDSPEFIVLDVYENGDLFCLAKGLVGESRFGKNSNYADEDCNLRLWCEEWLAKMAKNGLDLTLVKERELDLLSSGGVDYGKLKVKAAPLTLDEYRKYAKLCLTNEYKGWYWLATSAADLRLNSDGSPYTDDTDYAWYVLTDGDTGHGSVTNSYGVRPALILDSALLISNGK